VIPNAYAPSPPSPVPPRRGDRSLAVTAVAVLALLAILVYLPQFGGRPTDARTAGYRIDPNLADRNELMQVPGIGPTRADAIIARREQAGPFRDAGDLAAVKGIGTKTLDGIRSFVLPNGPAEPARAGKLKPGDPPLDVNRCPESELVRLPAIGPVLAGRIVAARPFATVDDLRRVSGIGAKILDGLRPYVTVEP
jgi:competence protein ComEA